MLAYLGRATGEREIVDLSELCRKTVPLLEASLAVKNRLKIDCRPRGPFVMADAAQVRNMLVTLVTNAWEAMEDGQGHIAVTIAALQPGAKCYRIRYPLDWEPAAQSYACIEVADTGCGMDTEILERIFDPFFSTRFEGRGLGLAVLIGAVKAHDGVVEVDSAPGGGSVFRIYLPLCEEAPPLPVCPRGEVVTRSEEGGLILVVDDEAMLRNSTGAVLRSLGYEVITAGDGREGVEAFRRDRDRIRCVLLDLSMPGMDGWEAMAAIRSLRPEIPVILTSGHDEARVPGSGGQARPTVFLHKPYLSADLRNALAEAMSRGGQTDPWGSGERYNM